MSRLGVLWLAIVGLVCGSLCAPAECATYPSGPVKILVPYAPGGATDIVARVLAEQLHEMLGQTFVVENKPGAFGIIAIQELAKAKPDGYTLMVGNVSTNGLTPILYPSKMSIDYAATIAPITRLADLPAFVIATTNGFPPRTLPDFISYAKAHPDQVKYGTVGVGSFTHFDMLVLEQKAGLPELVDVPMKGGASEVMTSLATGDVQVAFLNVASTAGLIAAGRLAPLAVVAHERLPEYPAVPTMAEVGFPGVGTTQWQTLFARSGTPKDVIDLLFKSSVAALKSDKARQIFEPAHINVVPSGSPDEAAAWLREDTENWRKIVAETHIKLDQ
jgi:tripartite-type tricarboxylate transporter receptor subunit TctC